MYSVDSPATFKDVDNYMSIIDQYCDNKNVLKLVVGNKCDLGRDRRITYDDLIDKAEEYGIKGYETSTMPGFSATVDDLFKDVVEQLIASKNKTR